MRIKQGIVGFPFFRQPFLSKFGLRQYDNVSEPVIFFSFRLGDYPKLNIHRSLVVIIWAGSDALLLQQYPDKVQLLKSKQDQVFHIAISNFISNDLKKVGIKHTYLPITPFTYEDYAPCPLGDSVYVYAYANKAELYGWDIIQKVREKLDYIPFNICTKSTYTKQELLDIYKRSFIGLRPTSHDGLSNTVVELGMMGRRVVWNGNSPNAIPYKSINDIVNTIKQAQTLKDSTTHNIYNKMVNFLDIGNDWLDTDYYLKKKTVSKKPYNASVVINTYRDNTKNLIRVINNYKNQKGVNVQIIISTVEGDTAIDIAKEYNCDLCVSGEPGIYQQLNNAIKLVKNDWYCYASGNDVTYPDKLLQEIQCCIKSNKLICYSDFDTAKANSKTIKKRSFYKYSYEKHLQGNYVNDAGLIHKSILDKYAPFKLEWNNLAYWDFWLRVYEGEGNIFCYNPNSVFKYIFRNDSSHIKRKKSPEETVMYQELVAKFLETHKAISKTIEQNKNISKDKKIISHTVKKIKRKTLDEVRRLEYEKSIERKIISRKK